MERLRHLGVSGAFVSVTALFFAWGFISSNNDPLIVALRAAFHLNYTEGLAVQLVSFLAFGLMSLPSAMLGNRLGLIATIQLALCLMLAGCMLVGLTAHFQSYGAILAALFVLAAGINILQVSANPLAAALGPPKTSHFRLSFAQGFNSFGVVLGAQFGSLMMLGDAAMTEHQGAISTAAQQAAALDAVTLVFASLAALVASTMVVIAAQRKRIAVAANALIPLPGASVLEALRSRWALLGAAAIGLYVGAEVSIGSIMINYLHQRAVLDLPFESGGTYLANLYWGGALVGRFIGSFLLTRVAAPRMLALCASMAVLLSLIAMAELGPVSGYAALGIGLFNSIMFPTIFTLTLERSGASQSSTSGLLFLAIALGALLPFLVGRLADFAGLSTAFAVPSVAYLAIVLFAWLASRSADSASTAFH